MALSFPRSFVLGVSTASFTNEGAWDEDGKGESIWDRFARTPGKIVDGSTPEVACDHYHQWRDDIALMKRIGINAYSFSISWPRILPNGFGEVNEKGLEFYDRLVDELLAAGITPVATLYHWDLPQFLEDWGGWTNVETALHFAGYAAACFENLGDRVKLWFTVNEPVVHAVEGYGEGNHAPGRKSRQDMLLALRTMLIAHGVAVHQFRAAEVRDGRIGAIVNQGPVHPATDSEADRAAAQRFDAFLNRWFLDPIFTGDYPPEMREAFGEELPEISPDIGDVIREPIDMLGINYYSRAVVADDPGDGPLRVREVPREDTPRTSVGWEVYPEGLYETLMNIRTRYGDLPLYITENGAAFDDTPDESGRVFDQDRIAFLKEHIAQVQRAIEDGVDLRGFFVYTLMDNWECALGFTPKFGLVRTDFETRMRILKASGEWYSEFVRAHVPASTPSPA